MVTVIVHGQSIGIDGTCNAALAVPVLCTDDILGECHLCGSFVRDLDRMGIQAVDCATNVV